MRLVGDAFAVTGVMGVSEGMTGSHPGGVPARLREARRAAGLSQAEAGGADLSASYVSLLESGRRNPTPAALAMLARQLGCSVEHLTHGHDPARPTAPG